MKKNNKLIVNQDFKKVNPNNSEEECGGILYLNDKTIAQFESIEKLIWNYHDELITQDVFNNRSNNVSNTSFSNELILKILM